MIYFCLKSEKKSHRARGRTEYENKKRGIKKKITARTGYYFSSASSKREDADPGGGEGVRVGLVHPYPG